MVCSVKSDPDADLKAIIPDSVELLSHRIGLKASAVSETGWLRVLRRRKTEAQVESAKEYLQRLQTSPRELQELIELIVVSETWFFRDRSALDFLITYIRAAEAKGRIKPWHALSLACATGEEPYSIAMCVAEAGVPAHRSYVEGVDISARAIERARIGRYGANSFRGRRSITHKRFFDKDDGSFCVQPRIQKSVKFMQDNVVSATFKLVSHQYDFVFCRNLLIYLTPEAQQRVFALCRSMIGDEGLVCFAPAEIELARGAGFVAAGPIQACMFHSKAKRSTAVPTKIRNVDSEIAPKPMFIQHVPSQTDAESLKRAMLKADLGHFNEALELCKDYLQADSSSVEANFLMGNLYLALRDEPKAREYLERVIYLDPTHYEALVALALVAERAGNASKAKLYWTRAKKQHDLSIVAAQDTGGAP